MDKLHLDQRILIDKIIKLVNDINPDIGSKILQSTYEQLLEHYKSSQHTLMPESSNTMSSNVMIPIRDVSRSISPIQRSMPVIKSTLSRSSSPKSSFMLGRIGENKVMNDMLRLFPSYEIIDTNKQPHSGDIHVINHNDKIMFMIEVKNKQVLTVEDITKYNDDLNNMCKLYSTFVVYGIFISLVSNNIPMIGGVQMDGKSFYLTQSYISDAVYMFIDIYAKSKLTTSRAPCRINDVEFNNTIRYLLNEFIMEYKSLSTEAKYLEALIDNTVKNHEMLYGLQITNRAHLSFVNNIITYIKQDVKDPDVIPMIRSDLSQSQILDGVQLKSIDISSNLRSEVQALQHYITHTVKSKYLKRDMDVIAPNVMQVFKSRRITLQEIPAIIDKLSQCSTICINDLVK